MFSHFVSAARELFGVDHHPSSLPENLKDEQATSTSGSKSTVDTSDLKVHKERSNPSRSRSPVEQIMSTTRSSTSKEGTVLDLAAGPRTDKMDTKASGKESRTQKMSKTKKRQRKGKKSDDDEAQSSKPSVSSISTEKGPTSSAHVRFDSEEPDAQPAEANEREELHEVDEKPAAEQDDKSESSDDEAPEAVGKDAALEKLKETSRKESEAKKRVEEQRRERRRERDQRLKSQAIKKSIEIPGEKHQTSDSEDDANGHSASSSTYHGSTSNAHFRPSLPALLPDDILNSEPAPLNIPATLALEMEQGSQSGANAKPTKRKFLDDYEREQKKSKPKIVRRGGSTYVVSGRQETALAPRANKGTNNIKQRWLSGDRKGIAGATSLRRTAPQVGGFIRR